MRLHRKLLATCCDPERHAERAGWQARVVTLLAEGVRPCVPQRTVRLGDGVEMGFAFIPPGTFLMGSPDGEEGRQADEVLHRVTLTRGFWLGVYPVTQDHWLAVMGTRPSHFKEDDRPVDQVSWDDCVAFCGQLGKGARLPTEAEWEYACRAGTTTAYHSGDGLEALKRAGWCSYDGRWGSAEETRPVGQLEPNAWGLFDMHGQVWEWCRDWFRFGPYPSKATTDPSGAHDGDDRVLRGGCWYNHPWFCRSAARFHHAADYRRNGTGFRVVLYPDE